jgi:negative regulator of flagellin synthesis FlgM
MQINGPSQVHGPHEVNGPHFNNRAKGPQSGKATAGSAADQVDISPAAEAAIQAAEGGELRSELVTRIRGEIASGTYETAEKLDGALSRLLDEIS